MPSPGEYAPQQQFSPTGREASWIHNSLLMPIITVITPHNTHAPLALQCLKAGRHVVCEKPLAITTAEVDAMVRAANKADVMLSTLRRIFSR